MKNEGTSGASRLVWVDLETTGLEPQFKSILEIGVIVTEGPKLEEVAAKSWVIATSEARLTKECDEWCTTQHKASGLWDECQRSEHARDTDYLARQVRGFILGELLDGDPTDFGSMCGSTISFDRAFLKTHLPALEKCFHYRNLDVSAYRVHMPVLGMLLPAKAGAHRTLDDLRDSIRLAKYAGDCMRLGYEAAAKKYEAAPTSARTVTP